MIETAEEAKIKWYGTIYKCKKKQWKLQLCYSCCSLYTCNESNEATPNAHPPITRASTEGQFRAGLSTVCNSAARPCTTVQILQGKEEPVFIKYCKARKNQCS